MDLTSERGQAVGSRWGWFVAYGVALAILGLIALWNVVDATLVTTIIVGWLLIFGGVAHVVGAFRMPVGGIWRVVMGLVGVLYVLVGFNLIADPLTGTITLAVAAALILIFDGTSRIVGALMERSSQTVLFVILGIVNILLGVWLWTGIPMSALAIGFYVGLQLLIAGTIWVMLGFGARRLSETGANG